MGEACLELTETVKQGSMVVAWVWTWHVKPVDRGSACIIR